MLKPLGRVHMTKLLISCGAWCALLTASDYPGAHWEKHNRAGWSEPLLKAAREYAATKKTAAFLVVQSGRIVDQWGDLDKKIEVRSIRKSFLSALYGIHVAEGHIDLGKTLGELGIDDRPPALTPTEKQATILDLLRARSGVYHDAARETAQMQSKRPTRGSHPPGSFYYYNNWDFNALGTIFQKLTGKNIFEEFARLIAVPLGMEDYTVADGRFAGREGSTVGGDSIHLNYIFSMTARDMARFGYLYLRNGRWGERQVIPANWVVRTSTSYSHVDSYSSFGPQTGYGLLWWTEEWGYSAVGAGGHLIAVIPSKDLVIVHRVAYDPPREDVVSYRDIDTMIRMVIAAAPAVSRE
jgi:CubicO group peptidase (beta-lactamase class C family)